MKFLKSMSLENKLRGIGFIIVLIAVVVNASVTPPMTVIVPFVVVGVGVFTFGHVKDKMKKKSN